MKKAIGIIILGLLWCNVGFADDISDFQIEGMSVGDSALDYFSEQEIKKNTSAVWPNKTYVQFCSEEGNFNAYQYLCFAYLKKDKKYIIHQLSGEIDLDFDSCLKELKKTVLEIEELFESAKKSVREQYKHKTDKKGKSIGSDVQFALKDGASAAVGCTDWSDELTKKEGWTDYFGVFLASGKFIKWNRTKAFK